MKNERLPIHGKLHNRKERNRRADLSGKDAFLCLLVFHFLRHSVNCTGLPPIFFLHPFHCFHVISLLPFVSFSPSCSSRRRQTNLKDDETKRKRREMREPPPSLLQPHSFLSSESDFHLRSFSFLFLLPFFFPHTCRLSLLPELELHSHFLSVSALPVDTRRRKVLTGCVSNSVYRGKSAFDPWLHWSRLSCHSFNSRSPFLALPDQNVVSAKIESMESATPAVTVK